MSSVREIDAFAGAAVPAVVAQAVAAPESRTQETQQDNQFELDAPVVAMATHAGVVTETGHEEIDLALDSGRTATLELARDLTLDVAPEP
jgi:hypothetical protein